MKTLLFSCLAVLTLNSCYQSTAEAQSVWYTDFEEAQKVAQSTNRPILIHFHAHWCNPCKQMESQVFPSRQVQQQLQHSVVAVKINSEHNPKLTSRFGVTSLPTDLFIEPSGKEIMQSVGYRGVNDYVQLVMRARTRYTDILALRNAAPAMNPNESLSQKDQPVKPASVSGLMLEGYCPVTLWKSRRWEKGSQQFEAQYKGQQYRFVSAEALKRFKESPGRYVPQFLGCDPVVVWETDRAVAGDIGFGAFYDERLYLFTSNENRQRFKSAPDNFIKTQVVLHVDQIESVVR